MFLHEIQLFRGDLPWKCRPLLEQRSRFLSCRVEGSTAHDMAGRGLQLERQPIEEDYTYTILRVNLGIFSSPMEKAPRKARTMLLLGRKSSSEGGGQPELPRRHARIIQRLDLFCGEPPLSPPNQARLLAPRLKHAWE